MERTNTNDKSWIDNRSSNDKSDRAGKSRQLDGYAVSYHPCTNCGKNHSSSMCKLINHPEASKKGEWVNSASYRCMETRLVMRRMSRSKETDRSRSDYSKRPKDDARKDSQDGRKYEGKPFLLDFIGFWVLVG